MEINELAVEKSAPSSIAWAAGILEGEGCFSYHKKANRPNTYLCSIHCEMTDEDVLESLHNIFGVGKFYKINQRIGNRKQSWRWVVYRQEDVFNILIKILPYMHSRRRQKIETLFGFLEEKILGS